MALAPELDINPSGNGAVLRYFNILPFYTEPDERGGDNTIETLGIINTLTEAEGRWRFASVCYVIADLCLAAHKWLKVRYTSLSETIFNDRKIVEACKRSLEDNPVLQHSIDWLTEIMRRFSEAALAAKPLTSVNMKSPMRLEKVCLAISALHDENMFYNF